MNNNEQPQESSQKLDELDLILLERDQILPSSGFAASVMDTITQEAAAPAPIPFPWKVAVPGFVALLAGFVILCRLIVLTFETISRNEGTDLLRWVHSDSGTAALLRTQVAPAALALAASFLCVFLCRKLVGASSVR